MREIVVAPIPGDPATLTHALGDGANRVAWALLADAPARVRSLEEEIGTRGYQLALAPIVRDVAAKLAPHYRSYVGELSTRFASDDWWSGCVSEKNPYISFAFYRVCEVLALRHLLERDPATRVVLFCDSPAMRRLLAAALGGVGAVRLTESMGVRIRERMRFAAVAWIRMAAFAALMMWRIAVARYVYQLHRQSPLAAVSRRGDLVTLVHSWADERAYDATTRRFVDAELPLVSTYLRGRGLAVATVARVLPQSPFLRIAQALAHLDQPAILPEAFLRPSDVVRALAEGVRRIDRAWTYPPFEGVDISGLLREDMANERAGGRRAMNWLFARFVCRLRGAGILVERAIYTFENHSWEKLFCLAMRREYPGARLIAQQVGSVPSLLTNFFISPQERDLVPLPDRIMATGSYCADMMVEGYGSDRVVVGGSQRGPTFMPARVKTDDRACVVVACSIGGAETVELVMKSVAALAGLDTRVFVKCHPSLPVGRVSRMLGFSLPDNVAFTERSLDQLLGEADVMLYARSAVCLLAVAMGVPAVHVESDGRLDYDHLECAPRFRELARNPIEVRATVQRLLARGGSGPSDAERAGVAAAVFAAVDDSVLEQFV